MRLKRRLVISKPQLVLVGVAVAAIGILVVLVVRASNTAGAVEAESGQVGNGAVAGPHTGASDGKAVVFTAAITSTPSPATDPAPGGSGNVAAVSTAAQLTAALAAARPGDTIMLADGTYSGQFVAAGAGTATAPITLKGGRQAILDGGSTSSGYAFHLNGASYWVLDGFSLKGAQKGLVGDNTQHSTLQNLSITGTGQEGLHLRAASSDNVIKGNTITDTGLVKPDFGEGIYLGSASSNWATYSGGQPDKSDRNQVISNTVARTGAESLDIKEGSTGGLIRDNSFDGTGMSGANFADSWVDVKGNNYTLTNNRGVKALLDGFQVHSVVSGWGLNNTFSANTAQVDGPGYGFSIDSKATGTVVKCDNTASGAAAGLSNIACTP